MAIKNVIVIEKDGSIEAWGSFKEICNIHGLKYHSLKHKKFPIEVDGWLMRKVPFRKESVAKREE